MLSRRARASAEQPRGRGVLVRSDYREVAWQEYHLTEAGRDLQPVLTALPQWGDKFLAGPAGPPLACGRTRCHSAYAVPAP